MVKATGILEDGVIRLREPVDLPAGTEVEVTIEPRPPDAALMRRRKAIERILARKPIDIRPYTVRDLIEEGRER